MSLWDTLKKVVNREPNNQEAQPAQAEPQQQPEHRLGVGGRPAMSQMSEQTAERISNRYSASPKSTWNPIAQAAINANKTNKQNRFNSAAKRLTDAQTNLGFVSDPLQDAEAKAELNAAQKEYDSAKAEYESTLKQIESSDESNKFTKEAQKNLNIQADNAPLSDADYRQMDVNDAWSPNWENGEKSRNGISADKILDWGKNVVEGAAKGTVSSLAGAQRAMYEAGQGQRTEQLLTDLNQATYDLAMAIYAQRNAEQQGTEDPDSYKDEITALDTKMKSYADVLGPEVYQQVRDQMDKAFDDFDASDSPDKFDILMNGIKINPEDREEKTGFFDSLRGETAANTTSLDLSQPGIQQQATKQASEFANEMQEESAQAVEYAKKVAGDTFAGNLVTDVAVNALQMAGDAATALLIAPGAQAVSLGAMGLRTFGSSAQEAEAEGATIGQQVGYGTLKAGIEVGTEIMFDGLAGIYGSGGADEIVEEVIRKFSNGSDAASTGLRVLFGALGEGVEEGVSGAAEPFAKAIYQGIESIPAGFSKEQAASILYDMLVGFASGGAFSTAGAFSSQNTEANANLRETDAIQATLEENGMDTKEAQKFAPVVKKAIEGDELSAKQKRQLERHNALYEALFGQSENQSPESIANLNEQTRQEQQEQQENADPAEQLRAQIAETEQYLEQVRGDESAPPQVVKALTDRYQMLMKQLAQIEAAEQQVQAQAETQEQEQSQTQAEEERAPQQEQPAPSPTKPASNEETDSGTGSSEQSVQERLEKLQQARQALVENGIGEDALSTVDAEIARAMAEISSGEDAVYQQQETQAEEVPQAPIENLTLETQETTEPATPPDQTLPRAQEVTDSGTGTPVNGALNNGRTAFGKTGRTYTNDNKAVDFTYAVVGVEDLIASNDANGNVNPAYPQELQPRDRTRADSQTKANKMSKTLNPERLAASAEASNGAPVVRSDGVVIGGNLRTAAIHLAYQTGNAAAYTQYIIDHAQEYGINPNSMPKNPVLVRIVEDSQSDVQLAKDLNESTVSTYSATEKGVSDSQKLLANLDILNLLTGDEKGNINSKENADFITAFVSRIVPESERGGMVTKDGRLSQEGLERVQNAIFAAAYDDQNLLARLSENLDENSKNIINSLLRTAASALSLKNSIRDGTVFDLKANEVVLSAVNLYTRAKANKQTIDNLTSQHLLKGEYGAEEVALAQFLANNNRSAKQISTFIAKLYEAVRSFGNPDQISLFDKNNVNLKGAFENATTKYESSDEANGNQAVRPDYGRFNEYEGITEHVSGNVQAESNSPAEVHDNSSGGNDQGTVEQRGTSETSEESVSGQVEGETAEQSQETQQTEQEQQTETQEQQAEAPQSETVSGITAETETTTSPETNTTTENETTTENTREIQRTADAIQADIGSETQILEYLRNTNAPQTLIQQQEAAYQKLVDEYGAITKGEKPARDVSVPRRTSPDTKVSESVRTIQEAKATPESRLPTIRQAVVNGETSFVPVTNDSLATAAHEKLERDGWAATVRDWTSEVRAGKASPELVAMGAVLLNNAGNNTNCTGAEYIDLMLDYVKLNRTMGRGLAAARILKTLSPEGRLYALEKAVDRMNEATSKEKKSKKGKKKDAADKMADATAPYTLDPSLVEEYRQQTTDEGRDAVIEKMEQAIADQIPSTLMDKFTAIRYLNMLGNFKTQGRNVLGNTGMMLVQKAKNAVRSGLESIAQSASGGKYQKQYSTTYTADQKAAARADFNNNKDIQKAAMGEKKFSDASRQFSSEIDEKRKIFKHGDNAITRALGIAGKQDLVGKGLDLYQKATNWAMEMGDQLFVSQNYTDALSGWMAAHDITGDQWLAMVQESTNNPSSDAAKQVNEAREFAIKQAQEATFRDTNNVSRVAANLGRHYEDYGFIGKVLSTVSEGIAPFRKTPANVAVRMEEYSPLGLINTAVKAVQHAKGNENVTGTDVIDSLAKTLTGTGLAIAGFALAAAGKARTKSDDDKQEAFDKLRGLQDYSISVGGLNFTYDWATPAAASFSMGVEMFNLLQDGVVSTSDALRVMGNLTSPMLEMSMLSSVNDALSNLSTFNGDTDALPQFLLNSAWSYLTQGMTNTLLGQAEQASEKYRQTYYTNPDNPFLPTSLQKNIAKAGNKTPGVDYQAADYIDAWGRKQENGNPIARALNAFLNPSYVSDLGGKETEVDEELQRLYEYGIGQEDFPQVYPQTVSRSMQLNGERLSPEEYDAFAITKGQKSLELVSNLIQTDEYKALSDSDKAAAISEMYSVATDMAKSEYFVNKGEDFTGKSAQRFLTSVDKPGTANDKTALKADNLPAYVAFSIGYKTATDTKDYQAIDDYMAEYRKLDKNMQTVLAEENDDLRSVKKYSDIGVGSQSYYTYQDALDQTQVDLDKSGTASGNAKLMALASADIPEADKKKIITKLKNSSGNYDLGSNAVTAYTILSKYGCKTADVSKFFNTAMNCKTWKDNGKAADQNGQLRPDTTAFALSQMNGLSDQQRVEIYNAIKSEVSSKYNDWGNYSYWSEIKYINGKSKANYTVPKTSSKKNPTASSWGNSFDNPILKALGK